MNKQYFTIGKIVNTQGIGGQVRVVPTTDDIKRFELLKTVELFNEKGVLSKEVKIQKVSYHKSFVLLKLEEVDTMTDAELLKGFTIKIPREQALPLEEDEYYISDLYGMDVVTQEGESLGVVQEILFTGANDVYIVRDENGNDILIPAIKRYVLKVNVAENKMTVVKPV